MLTVAMIISLGCNVPVAYAEEYWGEEIVSSQDAYDEVASAQDAQETSSQDVIEDNGESVDWTSASYVNINDDKTIATRTKEAITKKFIEAVNDRDASVYVQVGSSTKPYKPYIVTESAKKTALNLANYYRYLAGHDEVVNISEDVADYSWSTAGYGIVIREVSDEVIRDNYDKASENIDFAKLNTVLDTFNNRGEEIYEEFPYRKNRVGAYTEKDLITTFREYLAPADTSTPWREAYHLPMNKKGALLDRDTDEISIGVSEKMFEIYGRDTSIETYSSNHFPMELWPTAGYFPMEEIDMDTCWSFGAVDDYSFASGTVPTVTITDENGKVYNTVVKTVSKRYIYFTPPAVESYKNKSFTVKVEGYLIGGRANQPTDFEYTINFFSYSDVKLNIDGKTYTCDEYGNLFTYPEINVNYRTHVQTFGWEGNAGDIKTWKSNGTMSGTSGKAKRLEGINIVVNPKTADDKLDLGIQYTTHCQSYGWLPWSANGEMNGTEGEAKRLEAIKIQLTGEHANLYDVYYRVHAQSYGWLGWAKNGAPAGTAGYAKRLEGIQIVVVKKGASFNQKMEGITSARAEAFVAKAGESPIVNYAPTSNTNPIVPGAQNVNVAYRTHVQSYGWQAWKYNGQMSGTSGQAKRLEGINIELRNKDCSGDIVYTTHVQTYGWQGSETDQSKWFKNGQMAGTSGEAKRLEAICINLTGEMAQKYDIYYRVHAQSYGWLGWAKNGAPAGTAGYGKRLEGIQIVLVPKGGAAPGDYQGIKSVNNSAYVAK